MDDTKLWTMREIKALEVNAGKALAFTAPWTPNRPKLDDRVYSPAGNTLQQLREMGHPRGRDNA